MGGWCPLRDDCRFHNRTDGEIIFERLCRPLDSSAHIPINPLRAERYESRDPRSPTWMKPGASARFASSSPNKT